MTKKIMKTLAVAMCAVLLVAGSIAGTMAYLTDKTDAITNTFTAGNVAITLEETDQQASYKLIPGKTYTKDPTITVVEGSENCYLFVKVENGIESIEASGNTIASQLEANGWTLVDGEADVYSHRAVAEAKDTVTVFSKFTIAGEANVSENVDSKKITVTAYAVQADGFGTAQDAWDATKSGFGA